MAKVVAMELPADLQELVDTQDGLVTRKQAVEAGVKLSSIRHALRVNGPWVRIASGVYATFTGQLSERQRVRAALLYAGPQAIVTGAWACRAYGMRYVPKVDVPDLLLPMSVRRVPTSLATLRRSRHMPASRVLREIPCAEPNRATLDAVRCARSLQDVRAALCEVVQRGLTTPQRLIHAQADVYAPGNAFIVEALADVDVRCRSAPECEVRDVMSTSKILPEFVWNQPLPEAPDVVPDAYSAEARLALEIDSIEWHQLGDTPERTERRRARFAALGIRVLPIVPRHVRDDSAQVLAEIEAAYLAGIREAA